MEIEQSTIGRDRGILTIETQKDPKYPAQTQKDPPTHTKSHHLTTTTTTSAPLSLAARVLHYRRRLLRPGSTTLPLDAGKRSNRSRRRGGDRSRNNNSRRRRRRQGSDSSNSLGLALLGRRRCCDRRRSQDRRLGRRRDLVGLALLGRVGGAGAGLLGPGLALLRGRGWWRLCCGRHQRGGGGWLGGRDLAGLALWRAGAGLFDRWGAGGGRWRLSSRDLIGLALDAGLFGCWGPGSGWWCL